MMNINDDIYIMPDGDDYYYFFIWTIIVGNPPGRPGPSKKHSWLTITKWYSSDYWSRNPDVNLLIMIDIIIDLENPSNMNLYMALCLKIKWPRE
jgi:hypothetical protein